MTERTRLSVSLVSAILAGALGVAALFYTVTGAQQASHAALATHVDHHAQEIARNSVAIRELRGEIRGELSSLNHKLDRLIERMASPSSRAPR